ncbi:MAG: TetR/AcrR family transcriptional regulator [Steroidobacteraceae bacterium]
MSYIAERRLEEKEKRRVEILEAAESVAAEVGTEAMTMDQVARRARLSRALLYVYFKDKPDLLFGISERALTLLRTRFIEAVARHKTGLDQIEAIGRAYVAFGQEFPVYFDVLGRFHAHEPQDLHDTDGTVMACVQAATRVHDVIVECINAGIADGSVRPDAGEPRVVSFALYGMTHGTLQVATTKAAVLPFHGVMPKALIEQGILMARRSLAAKP